MIKKASRAPSLPHGDITKRDEERDKDHFLVTPTLGLEKGTFNWGVGRVSMLENDSIAILAMLWLIGRMQVAKGDD
jgi:hypothetical protein